MSVEQAITQLRAAGWPAVADDLADGVPRDVVLSRLRDICEADSDAAEIVAAIDD